MTKRVILSFFVMLLLSSVYGEGELNRFVDFEKNAAELKFIENPDFWAKEVDFSALSVWNDATKDMWGGGCEHRNLAGVAISPRHVLCSHHYGIPTETTLYFLGPKSGVIERKVVASDYVAQGTDLRVCLLDEDLPRDITPLKILPENYADYLGEGKGLISSTMNQYRELIVQQLAAIPSEEKRTQLLSATKPTEVEDAAKYKSVISGDSGCPRFLIINGEPILISLMWYGGSGSGVFIPHFRREIQNTMNRLAKGYELGEVSLAALPLYTPPSTEIKSPAPSPTAPNSGDANSGADNGSDDEDDIYDFIIIEDEYDDGEDEIVERVDIAAIVCTNGVVDIEFKWPSMMQIHKWDIFLKGYAELGGEATLSKKYNPASGTNLVVSVTAADFPESVLPHKYFFKVEAVKDSDHDGLSDELERQIGTDLEDADSDHDGLNDKFEVDIGLNPANDDMDGDGVKDGEEYARGTSSHFDEREMDVVTGVFYELIGTPITIDLTEESSTGTGDEPTPLPRESLAPNEPGPMSSTGYEIDDTISSAFHVLKTGLTFRPTRSGFFTFKIAADDHADVWIGNHHLSDDWYSMGDELTAYFNAEQNYALTADISNNGGRTYFNFVKFAELRNYPLLMKNELQGDTIIYEDAYVNKPGELIPKNSTTVLSEVLMDGGPHGGRLKIDVEGYDKIHCVSGMSLPEHLDTMLEPRETYYKRGIYEGSSPSSALDDVKIKMKFTENETGQVIELEETLTVVKIQVDPGINELGGETNHRHVFGPLESIQLSYEPDVISGIWEGFSASYSDDENADGSRSFSYDGFIIDESYYIIHANRQPGVERIKFSCGQAELTTQIEVIKPQRRVGVSPQAMSLEEWRLASRNAAFIPAELYCGYSINVELLPRYVSFDKIRITEGESDAINASGSLSSLSRHDRSSGAWNIIDVALDYDDEGRYYNNGGVDFAAKSGVRQVDNDWTGYARWDIPVYWQTITEATNLQINNTGWHQFATSPQVFRCSSDGCLSVWKLNCVGRRKNGHDIEYKKLR